MNFGWNQFGQITHGPPRVQAICDWVHNNIESRFLSGPCRSLRLRSHRAAPRTGHLPDIGYVDPGRPLDFHAYREVYLSNEWLTFDPRHNVPRIGRVKAAHGADAVGDAASLAHFGVCAYQVNPLEVSVGDPINRSKRLDGNQSVRLS